MIDLYYFPTPNGWKITIFLEETQTPYNLIPVDIRKGDQFKPEFLAISPNNRMPAIVDHTPKDGGEPLSVFESGAILLYLADKLGQFLPKDTRGRSEVTEWLMWQMGGLGPMMGQANHFRTYATEQIPYAITRYTNEVRRLFGVLDRRLATRPFLATEYSIADMAALPWVIGHDRLGIPLDEFPHVARWVSSLRARPAVERALSVGKDLVREGAMTDDERKVLFSQGSVLPSAKTS